MPVPAIQIGRHHPRVHPCPTTRSSPFRCAGLLAPAASFAQTKGEIRIAHVYSKTGPLEAYAKQTQTGLMMGLDYATGGTMMVGGKKLVVIEKDGQGKPDVGKSQLAAAYGDDKADIAVGPDLVGRRARDAAGGRGVQEDPAGRAGRGRFDHRRQVEQVHLPHRPQQLAGRDRQRGRARQAGVSIATLAQDYAFGRDGVKAFKDALKKAKIVHEEYLPPATTDFTAGMQRIFDALKDKPGRKVISVIWAGAGNPRSTLAALDLKKRYGIEVASGGNILPAMVAYKQFPGMEGATYYYFGIPKNPVNEWLVANHYKQFKTPPDFFTAGGMSAAIAVVEALKKTGGDTNTEKLIKTMEGMSFESPKGKMTFRKEDHQAMQSMYHFKIKVDPAFAWGVPELVREIKPEEMNVPIKNKR